MTLVISTHKVVTVLEYFFVAHTSEFYKKKSNNKIINDVIKFISKCDIEIIYSNNYFDFTKNYCKVCDLIGFFKSGKLFTHLDYQSDNLKFDNFALNYFGDKNASLVKEILKKNKCFT